MEQEDRSVPASFALMIANDGIDIAHVKKPGIFSGLSLIRPVTTVSIVLSSDHWRFI